VAGHAQVLAQHGRFIALNAVGGFIAANAEPLDGLALGRGFAKPDFEVRRMSARLLTSTFIPLCVMDFVNPCNPLRTLYGSRFKEH
jgi:hypothetical protein